MNFSVREWLSHLGDNRGRLAKDPRVVMRVILGILLVANLVAALVLFRPWGMSPEQMERELGRLQSELRSRKASVERMRTIVDKVEGARKDGDGFMRQYFLDRRTVSSTVDATLKEASEQAGLKQSTQSFAEEPIEGSTNLGMVTISGVYEGSYNNLVKFLNLIDRAPEFLILDSLMAAPERTPGTLNVVLRVHAFVIYGESQPPAAPEGDKPPESDNSTQELSRGGLSGTEAKLAQ